jgi:periplasmic copper chaperone A
MPQLGHFRTTTVWRLLVAAIAAAGSVGFAAAPASAGSVTVTNAQVPASDTAGSDVPLTMTVVNQASEADALLRVKCPFANFSERHTVDYGEGAPSMRAIPSIPLAAGATVALTAKTYHVMLLQTREQLVEGSVLTCSVAFRNAGSIDVAVQVGPAAAKE